MGKKRRCVLRNTCVGTFSNLQYKHPGTEHTPSGNRKSHHIHKLFIFPRGRFDSLDLYKINYKVSPPGKSNEHINKEY